MRLPRLVLLGLRLLYRVLRAILEIFRARLTLGPAHSLTHAEARCGRDMNGAESVWPCRVRQKPKMEIVLTKSAEFDAIVAEENEPNAGDFGEYYGAHAPEMSCSAFCTSCRDRIASFAHALRAIHSTLQLQRCAAKAKVERCHRCSDTVHKGVAVCQRHLGALMPQESECAHIQGCTTNLAP